MGCARSRGPPPGHVAPPMGAGRCDLWVTGFRDMHISPEQLQLLRLRGLNASQAQRELAKGPYERVGENHGRPIYKQRHNPVYVYFWDERDGAKWCGWWVGPHVGSSKVWSFNAQREALPPRCGWRVPW